MSILIVALACSLNSTGEIVLNEEGKQLKSDCESSAISQGYGKSIYIPQCQIAAENLSCGYASEEGVWL